MRVILPDIIVEYNIVPIRNSRIKGYKKDKVMYAISEIFVPSLEQLQNNLKIKEISSYEWKINLSDNYRDILNFCEDLGIIKCDHYYIEGKKSMGYMIAPEWISNPIIYEIEDFTLIKKFIKNRLVERNQSCPHLDKWITNSSLTLSISSEEYLENIKNSGNSLSNRQITYDLWTLSKFEEQDHTANRDQTSGRYHSIVTLASKRIRPFFRFSGDPIFEMDIKNSQPFCSLLLLEPDFYLADSGGPKIKLAKVMQLPYFSFSNQTLSKPFNSIIPSIKIREILEIIDNKDVDFYKFIVLGGKLYIWLQKIVDIFLNLRLNVEQVKEVFFYVLYSGKNIIRSSSHEAYFFDIKILLYSLLPNVIDIFNQFKKNNYKTLSILLQRVESYLIIDVITKSLPSEIPIYTIHDSILTIPTYTKYVQDRMKCEIENKTGYYPIIVRKKWKN